MALPTHPAPDAPLHSITAGAGPCVLCLHSSGSSSSQWRALIGSAQADFRFVAFDLYGHGRSADYAADGYALRAESDAVVQGLAQSGEPIHLVGHSYGGAVALDLAVRYPGRFASVTVFEPVLFALLDPVSPAFHEITSIGFGIARAAHARALVRASSRFIDYWNGTGSWQALSREQQARVCARIVSVARHFEALFADPVPIAGLYALRAPTLVLHGDRSPRPARAACARLAALPAVTVEEVPGLSHMGPVTHADIVNRRIRRHLDGFPALRFAA